MKRSRLTKSVESRGRRSWTPLENPILRLTESRWSDSSVLPEGLVSLLIKLIISVIVRVAKIDLGQVHGL